MLHSFSWNKLVLVVLTWLKWFCLLGGFSSLASNFILTAHCSLLALRNTKEHFRAMLGGGHCKQKKKKKVKNVILNRLPKRHLFPVWELKKKAEHCLVQLQLRACISGNSKFSPRGVYPPMTTKPLWELIWGGPK